MRWLIVGPYPPERGSGAEAARDFVEERLAVGDTVHVVSPRPTAAHVHQDLAGLRGLKALWSIAREQKAGGLWLRLESGIVLRPGVDQRRALVERAAFALFLRRFEKSVLDVGDVGLLPGGRAGRLVLGAAKRFVLHRAQDAAVLIANGAATDRIEQLGSDSSNPAPQAAPTARPAAVDPPPASVLADLSPERAAIEAAVRARAEQLAKARSGTDR